MTPTITLRLSLARSLARSTLFTGLLVFSFASDATDATEANRETQRMVERLQTRAAETALNNRYDSSARLRYLLQQPRPTDFNQQAMLRGRIAEQLLNSGRTRQAAEEFQDIQRTFETNQRVVPNALPVFQAIANLRSALAENCSTDQARRCAIPMGPDAIHPNPTDARRAIAQFQEILLTPLATTLAYDLRWLLNIAYMTIGGYPQDVPELWLIPPKALEAEYDIKPFPDLAPQLGLNTASRAGGSVMDDFDADGDLDIMASSWGKLDQLQFFRNNGDGTFVEATEDAGLEGIVGGLNLVQADYNNDGFLDLLVLRGAWLPFAYPNSLLHNNGDGTFSDVTESAGVLEAVPGQTASWGDFDNDGWLDLYVGAETRPGGRTTFTSQLFHNNRDGTFTDVAAQVGLAVVGYVKAVAWGDYDNDNQLDLYVSQLRQPNLLFHNEGPSDSGAWSFAEVGADAGVQEPIDSFPSWFFDYDNDGWLDIFSSGNKSYVGHIAAEYLGESHSAELPKLYRNNADGTFSDATKAAHLDKIMLSMGSNFGDLDNDGYLDFYVGTGAPDPRYLVPNRMFRNDGGRVFQEVTTSGGFGTIMKGHGVSFGDIDQDGDQDLYVVLGGAYEVDIAQNELFVNPGHGNSWITLRLQGVTMNRAAIGARIKVSVTTPSGDRNIYSTVGSGGSFGASSLQQEIGLGKASAIREVTITWSSSQQTDVFKDVVPNQAYAIREGDTVLTPLKLTPVKLGG